MINTNTNPNTSNPWFEKIQYIKRQNRIPSLPTPQSGQKQDCQRCGNKFLPGHLNVRPAKNEACRLCKKFGHFAKLCKSEMPPRPQYNMQQRRQQNYTGQQSYSGQQQQNRNNQLVTRKTPQSMRNINEEESEDTHDIAEETTDPESTCYIREMMEDWQNTANFIQSVQFTDEKVTDIDKTRRGEFWIQTKTTKKQTYRLADTGSPRSFMNIQTARNLLVNGNTKIRGPEKSIGEFRCFNNNKINILGTIQVDITSGTSTANNCTILLVDTNAKNIIGRDIMDKLGLRLTMAPQQKPGEKNLLNISNTHQKISKRIFQRYPHAKVFHNCDTDTATEYLEKIIKFHGIPRNIRCEQAEAFKSRQFEIFCYNHNIKLILAPAGDHRANGMIERLIKTIKRRLSVLNNDPKWSKITLADKLAEIIQEIKIIQNSTKLTTKISPFTAHFGRKHKTPISNIRTQTSTENLAYKFITKFYLDKKKEVWNNRCSTQRLFGTSNQIQNPI